MGRFAPAGKAATGLAAFDETQWLFFFGMPTSICEKELELAPQNGFRSVNLH